MVIREDLVASATTFLQDPSVAGSSYENKISFLKAKHLTEEEISVALTRASSPAGPVASYPPSAPPPPQYYGQYPPYGWQPASPAIPRRDWRDWFIMATVVGGVGYGLLTLTKRYIYPLVSPPTPERLEQDKKAIDEQFERAFALVEQLAKDTEVLKAAEQERTQRLDSALLELETIMNDLKSANRRREDEAQRVRDDVQGLKDALPKALDEQKDLTDSRLKDVTAELTSLKSLVAQRLNPSSAAAPAAAAASNVNGSVNHAKPPAASVAPASASASANGSKESEESAKPGGDDARRKDYQDYVSGLTRNSPFSSGIPQSKAAIPAWQMAMSTNNASSAQNGSGSASSAGA